MQTGMERFPQACGQWLQAAQPLQHPVAELVTAGPEARSLLAECHAEWYPLLISLPVCDRSLENAAYFLPTDLMIMDEDIPMAKIINAQSGQHGVRICETPESVLSSGGLSIPFHQNIRPLPGVLFASGST